jgi:hypothetical protein
MFAKKMLVVLLACAFTASVFAQDSKIYYGTRVGGSIGMSAPTGDWKKMYDEDEYSKFRSGGGSFDVAPFVSMQLTDKFALGTEFMFTRLGLGGYKYTKNDEYGDFKDGDWSSTCRAAMIIPVLAQLTLAERKVNIFAGPHFTINMGDAKESWDIDGKSDSKKWNSEEMKFFDDMKHPVVGLTVGAAFAAGPIFIDIRYLTDLGAVKHKDAGKTISEEIYPGFTLEYEVPDGGIRRSKLAFSVGYEFGGGSR